MALSILHEKLPPNACGTIAFPYCSDVIISAFTKKLSEDVRNRNRKIQKEKLQNCSLMAMFGVFEVREHDGLIHMHFVARGFDHARLVKTIARFNKVHVTNIDLRYCATPNDVDSITAYPFKFGYDRKVLFKSKSLKRYVYNCGKYFVVGKKKLREEDPLHYEHKKVNRLFDHNMMGCAPEPGSRSPLDQPSESKKSETKDSKRTVLGHFQLDFWSKFRKAASDAKQAVQEVLAPLLGPYIGLGSDILKRLEIWDRMQFGFTGPPTSSNGFVDTPPFP